MTLNFFRHPYNAMLLLMIFVFTSCSRDAMLINENKTFTANELSQIHSEIKTNFYSSATNKKSESLSAEQVQLLKNNIEYFNKNGLEALFVKNNLDKEIISELSYYDKNSKDPLVYENLLKNFNIDNQKEAEILFATIEIHKFVKAELEKNKSLNYSKQETARISWGCALAIAGTTGATVGFIWATGGTALIYAFAMKGLATAAIIEACGPGWGDI